MSQITKGYDPLPTLLIIILTYYLHWNSSNQDYLPLCTSSGCIIQLCYVSSISVQGRVTLTNKYGQADWHGNSYIPSQKGEGGLLFWWHLFLFAFPWHIDTSRQLSAPWARCALPWLSSCDTLGLLSYPDVQDLSSIHQVYIAGI